MKMERKFKFGLFSSFPVRLRPNRSRLAVLTCLKREAKFQNFKRSQLSSESTWSGLGLSERDKFPRLFAN